VKQSVTHNCVTCSCCTALLAHVLHNKLLTAQYLRRNVNVRALTQVSTDGKLKYCWYSWILGKEDVRNNFIKTFITGNSNDLKSVLFSGQTSTPYNKQGMHLDWIKLRITSSEADLPILPKNGIECAVEWLLCVIKATAKCFTSNNKYSEVTQIVNQVQVITIQRFNITAFICILRTNTNAHGLISVFG